MTIFSEIYGAYFRITAEIMSRETVSENDVYDIIRKSGFRDSALFLPQKLLPQKDGSDWGLLRKNGGGFSPITNAPPARVMTRLQKMWLKAAISDPRFGLFFDSGTTEKLSEKLSGIPPLYPRGVFRQFDKFSDGDDYTSLEYRAVFRTVLAAVKSRELLQISFLSGHDRGIRCLCLPLKIEYSAKNDKMRLHCRTLKNGRIAGGGVINIGRIKSVERTGKFWNEPISMDDYFKSRRAYKPATVRVMPERNAVERFLMEFASYEKRTERDLESGSCLVNIFYDKSDETELLIRLLSFGAAVEILAPAGLRRQAAERVRRQAELFVQ